VEWLELREIRVQLHRKGFRATQLRLWTTLLNPATAPATELVELYAQRWEHELFYREIKRQLRKNGLLQSHTVTTAAQENRGAGPGGGTAGTGAGSCGRRTSARLARELHQAAGVAPPVVARAGLGG